MICGIGPLESTIIIMHAKLRVFNNLDRLYVQC